MIKVGILGYGNLGKGVEMAISKNDDMELIAIFTRRDPNAIKTITNVDVISVTEIEKWKDRIDVMILCGGSKTDLPEQGVKYAKIFNTVDSFDIHDNIKEYFEEVDESAKEGGNVSIISVGWDPGLFSLNRLYAESILPVGYTYTFWGKGVSQGHSDAIRRIKGVKNAIQYTIPKDDAINLVKKGKNPLLTTKDKHLRECFVVLEDGFDKEKIEKEIKKMPNYFSDYETIVHFISEDELIKKHSKMSHGGFVIRSGETNNNKQIIEYSLKLESNPEFTGNVLVAYARAAYRLSKENVIGAKTVFDIPVNMISTRTKNELFKDIL